MRIGVYGGAFSPVHNGHIAAARTFFSKMSLDKLIIVPSCIPMHKSAVCAEARLEMCRMSFCDRGYDVSDIEIRRGGKNYTYDTLKSLYHDGDELIFLCGSDMAIIIDSWYRADDMFKICSIAVSCREGDTDALLKKADDLREKYGADISVIHSDGAEISSSMIRKMIAVGEDVSSLIPHEEYEYIKKNGLYLYE